MDIDTLALNQIDMLFESILNKHFETHTHTQIFQNSFVTFTNRKNNNFAKMIKIKTKTPLSKNKKQNPKSEIKQIEIENHKQNTNYDYTVSTTLGSVMCEL